MLKLNETPVRTARNFNINNIKIEDIVLPRMNDDFENIEITIPEGVIVEKATNNFNLKYGIGEDKIKEVNEKSNNALKIIITKEVKDTIEIAVNFDEENLSLIENIELIAEENSKSNIVLKYKAEENLKYYRNSVIRVNAKKNADINIVAVNLLNTKSTSFLNIENELEENAILNYVIVDFGGKNSITNYYSNLVGDC